MFRDKRLFLCVGLMAVALASVSGHTIVKREALTQPPIDEGVPSTPTPPVASDTVRGVKESPAESVLYESVVFEDGESIPADSNEIGPRYIEEEQVKTPIIDSFGQTTEENAENLEKLQELMDGGVFVVKTQEENEVFKGGEELKREKSTMDEVAEKMEGDLKVKEQVGELVVGDDNDEHLGNEVSSNINEKTKEAAGNSKDVIKVPVEDELDLKVFDEGVDKVPVEHSHLGNEVSSNIKEKTKEAAGNSKDVVKVPVDDDIELKVFDEGVDKVSVEHSLEDEVKLKVLDEVVDAVQLPEDENIKIEVTERIPEIGHNESQTQVVGFPDETQFVGQGQGQQEQQEKETLELLGEPRNNEEQEQLPQQASSNAQQVNFQLLPEEQKVELFTNKVEEQNGGGDKEIVTNGALNQTEGVLLGNEAVAETTLEPIELLMNAGQETFNADEEAIKATTTTTVRPWYSNLLPSNLLPSNLLPTFPALLETAPVSATTDVAGDGGSATLSTPGNGLFGFGLLVVPWNLGNLLANSFNFTAFPGLPLIATGQQQQQPEAEAPLPQGRHGLFKQLLNATAPNYSTTGGPIKAWKQLHNKTSVDTFFKSLFMPLKYALHYHSKPHQQQEEQQAEEVVEEVVEEVRHQGLRTVVNQKQQSKLLVPSEHANAVAPTKSVEQSTEGASHLVAPSSILLEVEISNPIYNLWRHLYNGYAPAPATADNAVATQG